MDVLVEPAEALLDPLVAPGRAVLAAEEDAEVLAEPDCAFEPEAEEDVPDVPAAEDALVEALPVEPAPSGEESKSVRAAATITTTAKAPAMRRFFPDEPRGFFWGLLFSASGGGGFFTLLCSLGGMGDSLVALFAMGVSRASRAAEPCSLAALFPHERQNAASSDISCPQWRQYFMANPSSER